MVLWDVVDYVSQKHYFHYTFNFNLIKHIFPHSIYKQSINNIFLGIYFDFALLSEWLRWWVGWFRFANCRQICVAHKIGDNWITVNKDNQIIFTTFEYPSFGKPIVIDQPNPYDYGERRWKVMPVYCVLHPQNSNKIKEKQPKKRRSIHSNRWKSKSIDIFIIVAI